MNTGYYGRLRKLNEKQDCIAEAKMVTWETIESSHLFISLFLGEGYIQFACNGKFRVSRCPINLENPVLCVRIKALLEWYEHISDETPAPIGLNCGRVVIKPLCGPHENERSICIEFQEDNKKYSCTLSTNKAVYLLHELNDAAQETPKPSWWSEKLEPETKKNIMNSMFLARRTNNNNKRD